MQIRFPEECVQAKPSWMALWSCNHLPLKKHQFYETRANGKENGSGLVWNALPGESKLWPWAKSNPPACFCKESFIGTQLCPFVCVWSMAAFTLHGLRWADATDNTRAAKLYLLNMYVCVGGGEGSEWQFRSSGATSGKDEGRRQVTGSGSKLSGVTGAFQMPEASAKWTHWLCVGEKQAEAPMLMQNQANSWNVSCFFLPLIFPRTVPLLPISPLYQVTYSEDKLNALNQSQKGVFWNLVREAFPILAVRKYVF